MEFINKGKIYTPKDIETVLYTSLDGAELVRTLNHKALLINVPCSFDIETSSFYVENGKSYSEDNKTRTRTKVAIMYEWTLGINGFVIIGRTWDEFLSCINTMVKILELSDEKRIVIYVHNLSYEFQFMRKHFEWLQVFAVEPRKPVYAITANGIEFRDSYILSGYSLAKLGDELQKYPVKKMVGDLDYSLIRHSETPLTDKELKYCENDVRVVMSYIQERIEIDGNIAKIPLTKTGYVRRFCKNECMYIAGQSHKTKESKKKFNKYRELMNALTLTPDEYKQAKRAFQGGFTHCNAMYSGKVEYNVASYDFTSSYPAVMVSEMYPMSRAEMVHPKTWDEFNKYLKYYCCMFDAKIINLRPKWFFENPLSLSRCYNIVNPIVNNGRIAYADELRTTMTEQDYFIYQQYYEWDDFQIADMRIYKKGYLPTDFIKAILKLYKDKTTLKGVKGKEVEYLQGKSMLNACYGMAVTDIVRDENLYNADGWDVKKADIEEQIEKYNTSKNRFLFYLWGVWVTAYARRNLFTGISEFKTDYIYSDTDSIKVLNYENHTDYIKRYNKQIEAKLKLSCMQNNIPFEDVKPKTIKGVEKLLGVWDFEGVYDKFKSIGAKRYLVEKDGEISMTVSGVNKAYAIPYLLEQYGKKEIFNKFDNGLTIPADYTGKNTHTYIDDEREGIVVDYLGKPYHYKELSAVHLEKAEFNLSLSAQYMDYLRGYRQHEK